MGTITIVIAVAPAIGPTVGGAVLDSLGWRWMFWLGLPLAAAVLIAGAILLRLGSDRRSAPLEPALRAVVRAGLRRCAYGLSSFGGSGSGQQTLPPWVPIMLLL
jgi:MFS transporter, DHA2 family, lincomycin resistance protein